MGYTVRDKNNESFLIHVDFNCFREEYDHKYKQKALDFAIIKGAKNPYIVEDVILKEVRG